MRSDAAPEPPSSARLVHGFRALLADVATLTLNDVSLPQSPDATFPLLARPTPFQQRAFRVLHIDPQHVVASTLTG